MSQLKALEVVHKNGALDGGNMRKSAAIAKRVQENRREEDGEGMKVLTFKNEVYGVWPRLWHGVKCRYSSKVVTESS